LSDLPNTQVGGGDAALPELSDAQFAEFAEGLLDDKPKRQSRQPAPAPQRASDAPLAEQPDPPDPMPGPEDPAPSDDQEELPDEPDEAADEADDSDHQGIDPPNSWSNADKELFRSLPPEAQAVIAKRESDQNRAFTQKTQELAQHRRAVDSTLEALGAERQRYAENLEQLLFVAAPEVQQFQQVDWQRLATEHPAEYVKMQEARERARGRIGVLQQELQGVRAQIQQQEAQQFAVRKQQEAQLLVEKLPDFADPDKGPKKIADMRQFLQRHGFAPQEISQAVDHRMLVLVDMAQRWERSQTVRQQAASKQNGRAPSVQRPGSARQGSDSRASQRRAEKMAALSRSGSEKDAMSYFLEVLDR
jgi:hypothetical protein